MAYIRNILNVATGNMQPKGAIIHNTADSGTAEHHLNRLKNYSEAQLTNGFAHFFIDRINTVELMPVTRVAWHCASTKENGGYPNANLIGYEVCQSMGSSDADFLANEEATFMQVAKDFKNLGITPNRETVRLHREFLATACPHRSWDLHGQSVNAVKDYFISRIAHYMGTTAPTPAPENPSKPSASPTVRPWNVRQVVDVDGLNVRAGQNTNSQIVNTLNKGQTFNATRRTDEGQNVDGYTSWFEVDSYGWVSGAYVTPIQNVTKRLYLPASATSWNVYPTNVAPVTGNQVGALAPSRYNGLDYDIVGNPQTDVVTIDTDSFGRVNIYVGAGTGAVIK